MQPLRLSEARVAEIREIIELGVAQLNLVRIKIADAPQKFLKLEQLSAFIGQELREDVAVDLATMCVQLRRTAYRLQIDVSEVLDSITEGLREHDLPPDDLRLWDEVRRPLYGIATDPKIELVVKTSDLYYKHRLHLHEAKILTDTRPVLNDSRDSIEAMILKNTLYLEYSDGNEDDKYIEIVLQIDEIRQLRDELDKAILKTETIKKINEQKIGVPVIVYDAEW